MTWRSGSHHKKVKTLMWTHLLDIFPIRWNKLKSDDIIASNTHTNTYALLYAHTRSNENVSNIFWVYIFHLLCEHKNELPLNCLFIVIIGYNFFLLFQFFSAECWKTLRHTIKYLSKWNFTSQSCGIHRLKCKKSCPNVYLNNNWLDLTNNHNNTVALGPQTEGFHYQKKRGKS